LLARGAEHARERSGGLDLAAAFDRVDAAVQATLRGEPHQLSWGDLILGPERSADLRRRFLIAIPKLDFHALQPIEAPLRAIETAARRLQLDAEHGIRLRVTGELALAHEEMQLLEKQSIWAGVASFVMVGGLLFAALRSVQLVLCTLLTLGIGLLWTATFAAVAIGHLNPISVAFAVLFIGLGVDFGIHLCVHYRENLESGSPLQEALCATARGVGSSLVICAVTTAFAFFAFIPTDYRGVAELGLISGMGMFVSLFCTLTVLPALLCQLRGTPAGRLSTAFPAPLHRLMTLPLRHAREVRVGAAALALGASLLALEMRFDHNPLRIRDPSTDSVTAFYDLLKDTRNSLWSVNVVVPDLATARTVSERLRDLDTVSRTFSLADLVPKNQDEKLAIVEDMALFLPPPESAELQPRPTLAEQMHAVQMLRTELAAIAADEPSSDLGASARQLHHSLGRFIEHVNGAADAAPEVALLEQSLLASLPERLRILYASLQASPISLADLPPEVTQPLTGVGGRLRVEVFPREDLGEGEALEDFVSSVHEVEPTAIGHSVLILESANAIVRSLAQALAWAGVAIALVLLLLWRRLIDTALVLIPLILAAVLTAASAVLLGIPLNFADVIVIPLILGIGVDSGIHLVQRHRMRQDADLLQTSTARAVWFSALTTVASFGTLGFSSHPGIASLGQLLTLGIVLTLACNLIVLPALLVGRGAEAARSA
jgi:hopanoid biosynthesis associated RND transporter like protein HpnN